MSLKSKASPELRIALRLASAIKSNVEDEPKSTIERISDSLLTPAVITLITGLVGFMSDLGTSFFQSKESMIAWQAQHNVESTAKIFSIIADLISSFQDTITRHFDLDAESYVLSNAKVFKAVAKIVAPTFDVNSVKDMLSFPTTEQIKENRENWSKL